MKSVVVMAGLIGCASTCWAIDAHVTSDFPHVEKAFWRCDYAATTGWVDPAEGAMCVEVYEDLKRTKFNGDFGALLAWWQENKAVEHQALARSARSSNGNGKRRHAFGGT